MDQESLKQFFPVSGQVDENINIVDVQNTNRDDVLVGMAILPFTTAQQKVVIYQLTLLNGEYGYRAISASCPHQGADIIRDELKPDGNFYCSIHRRPICVYGKFNKAYAEVKRDGQYVIAKTV